MKGTRQYRLFGILVWELKYEQTGEDDEEVEEGDHQGGQFEFGFRDSQEPKGQLDPLPIQEPGWEV